MANRLSAAFLEAGRGAISLLGREALRIVLPSWCQVCDRELPWKERTASCCADCWKALPKIETARCRSCAQPAPLKELGRWVCLSCERDPLPLEWCEAWGEYRGGLERLLHAFKFGRHDFLDVPLASLLEERLREEGDLAFDAVVAVPMSRSRERARGYNQAGLLGRALAERTGLPWEPQLLVKTKDRERQATLPRKDRAGNVRGAFGALPEAAGRAILIVDDICTTGETLRACAGTLIGEGAARVCAVTVAKAV